MVSNHMFTAVSAVILFFCLHAQSKNLRMRRRFDDAAATDLHKRDHVRPLGAPPVFVQQHQDPAFKPPTQEVCDQVADMAKGEMKDGVVESTCDAVIYGAS